MCVCVCVYRYIYIYIYILLRILYIVGRQVAGQCLFHLSVFSFFEIRSVTPPVSHSDIWLSLINLASVVEYLCTG